MELVKDGIYGQPEDWKADVTCKRFDQYDKKGCGAEYIIDATDLVLRYFRGSHFIHYYPAVQCEQCEKYTRVNDVPVKVLRGLNRAAATFDGFDAS